MRASSALQRRETVTGISLALASFRLSAEEISKRSKLPVERVRSLMAGENPRLSEVQALSVGLRVPRRVLSGRKRASEADTLGMAFRAMPGLDTRNDVTLERVSAIVEASFRILPFRDAPSPLSIIERPNKPDYGNARQLAYQFRHRFLESDLVSPILNLPRIVGEIPGVILSLLKESRIEGASLSKGNYVFIFVSPRFNARMLFTLAHEVGHVLAGHIDGGAVVAEGASSIGASSKGGQREHFVNAFASCLLMPDEGVIGFLRILREQLKVPIASPLGDIEILYLARFFGVSFEVAAHRCEDLHLLPAGGGSSISQHLRLNHRSPERRAVEVGIPAREDIDFPALSGDLARSLIDKVASGDISAGWASEMLGISITDIVRQNKREPSI